MNTSPIVTAALILVTFTSAWGMPIMPEPMPVKKLVAITERKATKNPKNAEAQFMAGRTHYLAFVSGTDKLEAYPAKITGVGEAQPYWGSFAFAREGALNEEAERRARKEMKLKGSPEPEYGKPTWRLFQKRREEIKKLLVETDWRTAQAAIHAVAAFKYFQSTIELDPNNALYRLGYASLLEQSSLWAKHHPKEALPELVRTATPTSLRENYRLAWKLGLREALHRNRPDAANDPFDFASYEAGTAYLRLSEKPAKLSAEERNTAAEIRLSLKQIEEENQNYPITPIVFSLKPAVSLADLLAPETVVKFPLRGWGPVDRWSWVKPETGLLVWNPSRSGKVVSGAQLFGSYTWELFWNNGYEPLAVLDEDGDGELRGAELAGLAVWFDRNSNGHSDPGEVQPLSNLGVQALATHPTAQEGVHPSNPHGITFNDGRVLPTWDWTVAPVPNVPNVPAAPAGIAQRAR